MEILQGLGHSGLHMHYNTKYKRRASASDIQKNHTKSKDEEVLDFLRSNLLKAFDEGHESPYDLRESVVEELLKVMDTTVAAKRQIENMRGMQSVADIPNQRQITESVIEGIPSAILGWMTLDSKIWLCGGSIIKLLIRPSALKSWNGSDWDLFCSESAWQKLPFWKNNGAGNDSLTVGNPYDGLMYDNKKIKSTWCCTPKGFRQPINIIVGNFDSISDVYDSFDFRFLQMGCSIDGDILNLSIGSMESWVDLTQNIIRWNDKVSNKTKNSDQARKRIIKYINRGFRDGTGVVEKGILSKHGTDLNHILQNSEKRK